MHGESTAQLQHVRVGSHSLQIWVFLGDTYVAPG
jgi:hypothetical protein